MKKYILLILVILLGSCTNKILSYSTDNYYVTKVTYYKSDSLWVAKVINLNNKQNLNLIFAYKINVKDTLYGIGNQEWRKIK